MDKLKLHLHDKRARGTKVDLEASLNELRALSSRLADVLRPHWPQFFKTHVPVAVRWPDELAGTHVEVMTEEGGAEIFALADAPGEIRRHYLRFLDDLIALRVEDGDDVAELDGLRSVIAELA
jgi:hypothetical protein